MKDKENNEKVNNVILFPDFEKLKNEVEKLRAELCERLYEYDELRFVICENIETDYMLKLGGLEYKAYEAQCEALRLKRKLELIQAKKNRQEKIIVSIIEATLDAEFAEYQAKLNEQIEKMNNALERNKAGKLSEKDDKELKTLYRKIVKTLHPDIKQDATEQEMRLFNNAVSAYKNGDLMSLRVINEMVSENTLQEKEPDVMKHLANEKERLEGLIKSVYEKIHKIKSEYPFNMKEILEDSEKVAQKRTDLEKILSEYKEIAELYSAKIEELLR